MAQSSQRFEPPQNPGRFSQRKMKDGWPRVRQHLFKTPEGTASKLHYVRHALASAREVGVTGALVLPDSLRLAVEEEVIFRNTSTPEALPWNEKSRRTPLGPNAWV
ncbi:hypothetical protein, partial [Polaromonas sp.]|uniref:hypothetical protein n=1 Tax=Polaromonas sp. TaxID=1869339 RepID=UPI00352AB365